MTLSRRRLLRLGTALAAAVPLGAARATPMSAGEAPPHLIPPVGSIDSHMHLYDSRIPAAPGATLLPSDASLEDYRALQRRLGIGRMVIVTPSTYGTDNRVMLDGLLRSRGDARGVAVVSSAITDAQLESLHQAGVRGIRFNLSVGSQALDGLESLAARVAELKWNVQIAPGPQLPDIAARLLALPGKLVIDHMGHVPQPEGLASPAFNALLQLLDTDRAWVKLSAPYLRSKTGAQAFEDVGQVARSLIRHRPDRLLWGSDWPHPTLGPSQKPDDAQILDLLLRWAPDERTRTLILRDNPALLFGFEQHALPST